MFQRLAVLAVLVGAGATYARAAEESEQLLAAKKLVRSGSMFLLRAEDDVRKASEAADAKLKEYRRASAWEHDSTRNEADRKTLAAALTKQRTAMKQEMDQFLPQLQGQIREIQQQQQMLNQQRAAMGGSRVGRMAANQLSSQSSQLGNQINMIQAQSRQITSEYNDMGSRIEMLNPKPGSDLAKYQEAQKPKVSSKIVKTEYADAVAALRKVVDETKAQYETLAGEADVTAALAKLDQHSSKIKHTLGPSKKFLDTVKTLEQAEKNVADDTLDPPPATPRHSTTSKRKTKTAKRQGATAP